MRRQSVEFENLSAEDIQRQLEEMEQNKAALQKALQSRREQAKAGVVEQVLDLIQGNGYEIEEIVSLLPVKRRRGPNVRRSSNRQYTKYVDPKNAGNVYVRGVLPRWMKDKMQEQGYDPGSKEDREAFKANYLQVEDA